MSSVGKRPPKLVETAVPDGEKDIRLRGVYAEVKAFSVDGTRVVVKVPSCMNTEVAVVIEIRMIPILINLMHLRSLKSKIKLTKLTKLPAIEKSPRSPK